MNHVTVSSSPIKVTLRYGQPVKVILRYGQKGKRGIGISSVALDEQAHLIVTYDNGKTQDAGAALGDVTSIKDGIDSAYNKVQTSEANVTKLEASTRTSAENAQQALQDTQSASASGVNTINALTTEKMTYMTNTFNSLLTQAKANIDKWERDAKDRIHTERTYSLEQIKNAHDDAMVDIERSVNKAEAWAVSETTPDREPDFESPTGLTQSSRSWAMYSKKKVQEAADTLSGIKDNEANVSSMKNAVADLLRKTQDVEQSAQDHADAASDSKKAAKESEKTAEAYMENTKAEAKKVNTAVTTVTGIAAEMTDKLNKLQNPLKELNGETKGALHILYFDNTEKDITLADMGADTSTQVSHKVAEALSTAKLYTDQKVSNLVGGAPEALDTLKELAKALGDDSNFSTTILNKIGEKESKTDAQIEYKKLQDAIPTKVSQLSNDSGYQKTAEIPIVSQTQNGYMSKSDKAKLDGIEEGAKNVTDYVQSVTESNGKITVTKGNGDSTTFDAGYTSPTEYRRAELPISDKTTITISKTRVVINGHLLETTGNALSLSQSTYWDNETYVTAANRAGKDFYIYACIPDSGAEPKFILSANSTVPTGYTADNSRKIGGFHCLCASVGTISGHSLSGYITGDILPASVWDLLHRCKGENEGMVYDAYDDVWIGIYLLSYDNGRAVSRFNGVILDGESTPKTHGLWFTETLAKQKMRLPYLHEFFNALKGCQEQVNISGSKDWNTTGGHVYTNNVRCISNIGLEDPTGFMGQWTNNYGMAGGSEWGQSAYDSQVDSVNRGGTLGNLWLPLVGGVWAYGSDCGSRSVIGNSVAAFRIAFFGARPASEPRVVIL